MTRWNCAGLLGALAIVVVAGCHGGAQTTQIPEATPSVAAAVDAKLVARCLELERRALEDNEAIATLRSLVTAAPKRLSGSPGMADAEQWALSKMREIGFDEVRAEP